MGNSAVQDMGRLDLSSGQLDGQPAVLLDLGASQTLQSAPDLHAALAEATDRGLPLVVDASSVEQITTSAVQLLIAAGRRMAAAEEELSHQDEFGYRVINDDFDAALAELEGIVLDARRVPR